MAQLVEKTTGVEASGVELRANTWEVDICGWAARVVHRQLFAHRGTRNVEAVYRFPFDQGTGAVTGFEARMSGGRLLRGVLEDKQVAADAYEDALASGHTAMHMGEAANKPATLELLIGKPTAIQFNANPSVGLVARLS